MRKKRSFFERLLSFFQLERTEGNLGSSLNEQIKTENNDVLDNEFQSNSAIFREVVETFKDIPFGTEFNYSDVQNLVVARYPHRKEKKDSIVPSDYCYNKTNNGIKYGKWLRLFEYTENKTYRYLGLNYPYTGPITHQPKGKEKIVVGELKNGILTWYERPKTATTTIKEVAKKRQSDKETHKTKRNVSDSLRYKILKRDNFTCCACGASPAKDPSVELHVDHIIPWSKGGETTEDNLQTLCSRCNLGKSNKF